MFRKVIGAIVLGGLLSAGTAFGQSYPERDVRIVVGFAPGGTADALSRLFGDYLSKKSGKSVIVENMTGASGNIASKHVVESTPDGYTLLSATTGNIVINKYLYTTMTFDPVVDLAPVASFSAAPAYIAVRNDFPAQTLSEFLDYVKDHPGEVTYGSSGVGSTTHLGPIAISKAAGLDMVHVPYKGVANAAVDLSAGRIDMMNIGVNVLQAYVANGSIRLLAVASNERSDGFPDVPTAKEAGFDYIDENWFGLFAPKGTPDAIVEEINTAVEEMLSDPTVLRVLDGLFQTAVPMTAPEYRSYIEAEDAKWKNVVEHSGIRIE